MILIDSSVWIDTLSSKPTVLRERFNEHLERGDVATIRPIVVA